MKVSVSLSADDLATVDEYAREAGLSSRSAVIQRAIDLLRHRSLGQDYAEAWEQWQSSGEAELWDAAAGDGLVPPVDPADPADRAAG